MQLSGVLNKIKTQFALRPTSPDRLRRELVRQEAIIGAQLFGPVPTGHSRDFFCLDEHTWIWHETWRDTQGKAQAITTRYEIYPDKIIKAQDGQPHQIISGQETANLLKAAQWYYRLISNKIYGPSV